MSFFTKEDEDKLKTHNLLWFDNDKTRSLQEKIIRAGNFYFKKYQTIPTRCQVNPADFDKNTHVEGIKIEASKTIMPNHFWIGLK